MRKDIYDIESEYINSALKTERVYRHLKRVIVFQHVPPRTRLDMKILAHQLGVSYTPIRDAILRLNDEGLVSHQPCGGYFTKQLSFSEIAEDYDISLGILKHVIDKKIKLYTGNDILIPQINDITSPEPDEVHRYCKFIEHLSETIAGLSKNKRLLNIIKSFNERTSFIRLLDLQRPERFQQTVTNMDEFLFRMSTHDGKGAIENLERQNNLKMLVLNDLVKEGNILALNAEEEWIIG